MNEWLEIGMQQVHALLNSDADFQELTERLHVSQKRYHEVIEKLPPDERQVIEDYVALCEKVEYQKTHTAYFCGKKTDKGERFSI